MSSRGTAASGIARVAVLVLCLAASPWAALRALAADAPAAPPSANASGAAAARYSSLIVRVDVNAVPHGDVLILRDSTGRTLVPASEFATWNLAKLHLPTESVDGETYVVISGAPGLLVRFDPIKVTLSLEAEAGQLPGTSINLAPQRRADVVFPTDNSFFLNYAANVSGDENFNERQYQFATELAIRRENWLLYNTTTQQWGGVQDGFVRLLTNLQYDDRPNLRRWTIGDFFTPNFDLAGSVPMAGVSLTKYFSMDPYFVQYPTAGFRTEVVFPSTVQVRIDGNVVAQRQVTPGPLDITNITSGITGGQNVSVVLRDAFGREQVLQQPFFFATNYGLAKGLHEYSYNVGALRQQYGIESNEYSSVAASAFHRYAFTDELTLGLRGQASKDVYNIGPFGTYQSPALGIVGAGVSVGGTHGATGGGASVAYSYTNQALSVSIGSLYRSANYGQLSDVVTGMKIRTNTYASGSLFFPQLGSLGATYNDITTYEGPASRTVNTNYTRSFMNGRSLLSLNFLRTLVPGNSYTWLLSFRYFFDPTTSVAAAIGGSNDGNTQALSLQKSIPEGVGVGYDFVAGHFAGDAPDGLFGRAFVQANAEHFIAGGEYARANNSQGGSNRSQLFFAGSLTAVDGHFFAARPVTDSFALVRVPELKDVPVYANGWYVGQTNAEGEVVATNIASYYDNFISFRAGDLPLDYIYPRSDRVISPALRSGTLVAFDVRKNHAIFGSLVTVLDGKQQPLEFREFTLRGKGAPLAGFTARRGEFYVEGLVPGDYTLEIAANPACSVSLPVPAEGEGVVNLGTLVCQSR
ncbi:MAG: fimbria/pilus outer membrane usher protein [Burkholderiales bacterium]